MKKIIFWILAVIITIGASVYQRMTGPTHAKTQVIEIDGKEYSFKFPRSGGEVDCKVSLLGFGVNTSFAQESAVILWRKFPANDKFQQIQMKKEEGALVGYLPVQPHAGKLEYYLMLTSETDKDGLITRKTKMLFNDEPLIIRFKGDVPAGILIPHILFMFLSMLFASYTLLAACAGMEKDYKRYIIVSTILLFIGGFIFGPLVQYYAFDIYWSGFPIGSDLTDNKTLIAAIVLLSAIVTRKQKWNKWVVIASVIVMFIVFSIPHSMRGSELNHETGMIETSK